MNSGDFVTLRFVSPQRGEYKGKLVVSVSLNGNEIKTVQVMPDAQWHDVMYTVGAVLAMTGELDGDFRLKRTGD